VVPRFQDKLSSHERFEYKHMVIKHYIKKRYKHIINLFKEKNNNIDSSFADNYPIWFLWWQGEDAMPPIVQVCYQALIKNSNGHEIHLITRENFKNFATIPDYILKKVNKKIISLTHFSDILRMCLLYEHGGLWIDATVLLTKSLPPLPLICAHLGFWTPKDNCIVLNSFSSASNWIVRENKWVTFCLYLSKNNLLAEFVRKLFFEYFKRERKIIDYYLFDYFISLCYDNIPDIRVMIDSVPQNNPRVHDIQHLLQLNYEYNEILFNEVCSNTFFHKLNWKKELNEYTENGKLTNYGYIMRNFSLKQR
jgi:mannosyltransferase OCH1-like enzyme